MGASRAASAAADTSSATASSTGSATRSASGRGVAAIEVRPEPHRAHRALTTRTARSATSSRPTAPPSAVGQGHRVAQRRHQARQPHSMPLDIPLGTTMPTSRCARAKGAQLVRSAGSGAVLMAKDGDYAQMRMPGRRIRQGSSGLPRDHRPGVEHRAREHLARQGRSRSLDRQASAQPRRHDEPGRSPDGRRRRLYVRQSSPCSPWGQLSKGQKTRNNKRTDSMIIKRRRVRSSASNKEEQCLVQ